MTAKELLQMFEHERVLDNRTVITSTEANSYLWIRMILQLLVQQEKHIEDVYQSISHPPTDLLRFK